MLSSSQFGTRCHIDSLTLATVGCLLYGNWQTGMPPKLNICSALLPDSLQSPFYRLSLSYCHPLLSRFCLASKRPAVHSFPRSRGNPWKNTNYFLPPIPLKQKQNQKISMVPRMPGLKTTPCWDLPSVLPMPWQILILASSLFAPPLTPGLPTMMGKLTSSLWDLCSTESTLSSSLLLPGFSVMCRLLMPCQHRQAGPPVCLPFLPKACSFTVLLPPEREGRG